MKYLVPGEKYVTFCLQHFSMSWSIFSSCVGVNLQLCSWPEPMSLQRLVYRRTEATTKSLYGNIVGSSFRQSHLRHFDVHRNGDRRSSIWGNRSSFRNSSGERPVVSLAFHLYAGKKDCCLSCVLARQSSVCHQTDFKDLVPFFQRHSRFSWRGMKKRWCSQMQIHRLMSTVQICCIVTVLCDVAQIKRQEQCRTSFLFFVVPALLAGSPVAIGHYHECRLGSRSRSRSEVKDEKKNKKKKATGKRKTGGESIKKEET